jgi:DNA-3-methyladenine glycosylase I
MTEGLIRCWGDGDPLMATYHDEEWGYPVHDDQKLFEHLMLDCFQAGLSWRTILHKREGFLRAFDNFDPHLVAKYSDADRSRLLADEGIVRNRLKINAAISNAQAFLKIVEEFGSFDQYIWGFTDHKTLFGPPRESLEGLPSTSPEAQAMSKDLKARGFKFVGPTVCYAFMQTVGMVDDHLEGCFRYIPR